MYTLTKLKLEKGNYSMFPEGYSSTLPTLQLFDSETDEKRNIFNLNDVLTGWQVILTDGGYHRTSKIKEIVKRTKNKIVFKTQTYLYELIKFECLHNKIDHNGECLTCDELVG